MLSEDIAKLMSMIPHEEVQAKTEGTDQIEGKDIYSKHHKHWPSTYSSISIWICGHFNMTDHGSNFECLYYLGYTTFYIKGGAFNAVMDQSSVFGHNRDKGVNEGKSRL